MTKKKKPRKLAVLDLETDPFLYGRKPEPFAAGFYDGTIYQDFWGPHCVTALVSYLERYREPLLIYAHNGGKFDFFYFIEAGVIVNPIMIINGRLVKLGLGEHELRDSYSIIPVALAQYQKEKIDYDHFESEVRDRYKTEILAYLKSDCINLFEIVKAFNDRFGPMLTVGGTAIKELQKFHEITRCNAEHDAIFRPFYFGGRVSVFKPGIHKGNFKVYDVNSMYPYVMKNYMHPSGLRYLQLDKPDIDSQGNVDGYPDRPYFARLRAINHKALPIHTKVGLSFDQACGEFLACSHEIRVALKHRLIEIQSVETVWLPLNLISFDQYVDHWVAEKIAGKLNSDKVRELFAKFMLNSAYGKFGQNPANYFDYFIKRASEKIPCCQNQPSLRHCATCEKAWRLHIDYGEWEIWKKPTPKQRYLDVAIAASITSAARAVLLDSIQSATDPLYCDTDSIICSELAAELSDTALGAWKLEAEGNRIGIAGKKLYSLYNGREAVKMASKGADLNPADIFKLAKGQVITWRQDPPRFKLGQNEPAWIKRNIKRTA